MSEKKIYRESEVTGKKDKSTWLIIHDNVYDVTKFLEEVSHKLITSQYLDWSKSRTVTSIMSYFTKVSMSVWKVLCNFSMNDLNGQPFEMNFERFFFQYSSSSQHCAATCILVSFLYKVFALLADYWYQITIENTKRPKSMKRIMQYAIFVVTPVHFLN